MTSWFLLAKIATLLLLAFAGWRDVATRLIPDSLCVALAVLGLAIRAASGLWAALASTGVAVLLFALLAVAHARGLLGGGDVKLMAATAMQFPPAGILHLLLAISVAGGVLAAVHLALRRLPAPARHMPRGHTLRRHTLRRLWAVERWRVQRGSLPYGVAIACGGAWILLLGRGI